MGIYKTIIFGCVGLFIYLKVLSKPRRGETFSALTAGRPRVTMVQVDWCGHCQTAKPWFQRLVGIQTINGKQVEFRMINGEQSPEAAAYNVQGYPSFFFESGSGQPQQHSGGNTRAQVMDFVKSRL